MKKKKKQKKKNNTKLRNKTKLRRLIRHSWGSPQALCQEADICLGTLPALFVECSLVSKRNLGLASLFFKASDLPDVPVKRKGHVGILRNLRLRLSVSNNTSSLLCYTSAQLYVRTIFRFFSAIRNMNNVTGVMSHWTMALYCSVFH